MPSLLPLSPSTSYILGLFAADGTITINKNGSNYVEFTSIDQDLLDRVRTCLGVRNKIGVRKGIAGEKNRYRLQIGSKNLVRELFSMGFSQRKSQRMTLPSIPHSFLSDFVRGYFDGDGNVLFHRYPRKNRPGKVTVFRTVFTSCSKPFLDALRDTLRTAAELRSGVVRKEKTYYRLVYALQDSKTLCEFLYNQSSLKDSLFLSRKKQIFEEGNRFLRGRGVAWPNTPPLRPAWTNNSRVKVPCGP